MLFSADVRPKVKHWLHKDRCCFYASHKHRTSEKRCPAFLLTELYNRPSTNPSRNISSFQWWFTDVSTLGVKYAKKRKKRQVYWVSCIRILDYRGSKLEAQMTLGHVYLVHHSNFTYNIITEIKRALHNRVLLPHLFSFRDQGDNEHEPTDHKIRISQRHLRYRVP